MPSRYEPCGLEPALQPALRHACRSCGATGGLADTVREFDPRRRTGTGFVFDEFTVEDLVAAARRAGNVFRQPAQWAALVKNAMAEDFSWDASAREYVALYRKALKAAASP